ncbi:hypothetical protein TWF281_011311 [Arthrobotrys megalospora]
MSDILKLSSKLQSASLADTVEPTHSDCPLSVLPIDILTHHLIPQFANPPIYLESSTPVLQSSPSSKSLLQLASTSKHFRSLVKNQYKTYLQHQYPAVYSHAIQTAGTNLDKVNWFSLVAHSEKLCHRWSLRQFYLSRVEAGDTYAARPHQHDSHDHRNSRFNNRPLGSYSPCIDVSESLDGTETLAIGQGPIVSVRVGEYSPWREIKRKNMVAGADDILSVHIYNADTVIASRSSSVEIISNISTTDDGKQPRISQATDLFPSGLKNPMGGISSSCLDPSTSSSTRSFAITTSVTSTDTHSLQFFALNTTASTPSLPKQATLTSPLPSKPYTSTFLTSTTIATGHRTGVTLHNLAQSSLSDGIDLPQPETSYNHALGVHSLTRLSPSFSPSILASGWSDGITRLFDIRANTYVANFENPVSNEAVPIYSLCHTAPLGNILLAGTSMHHAVEMHDLRYSRNMVGFFSPYMFNPSLDLNEGEKLEDVVSDGCLMFFNSGLTSRHSGPVRGGNRRAGWGGSTAVYSLASASHSSGKVYIGVENNVLEMNFRKRKVGKSWGYGLSPAEKVRKKEAERGQVLNLPMYWFDPAKRNMGEQFEEGRHGHGGGRWWCGNGKPAYKVRERGR